VLDVFQEFSEAHEGVPYLGDFLSGGTGECLLERVVDQVRHGFAHEFDYWRGGVNVCAATIGGIGTALYHTISCEAVNDAGDGGLGKAYLSAQIFEVYAVVADDNLHDGALWGCEIAFGDLGFEGLAEKLAD